MNDATRLMRHTRWLVTDVVSKMGKFFRCVSWWLLPTLAGAQPLLFRAENGPPVVGADGVVLSHANILANGVQMSTRIDFSAQDIIFNALPLFHSFGLSAGTLLPLLSGMRTFFYPTPLHYRIVPEMVYAVNATIMFGTLRR